MKKITSFPDIYGIVIHYEDNKLVCSVTVKDIKKAVSEFPSRFPETYCSKSILAGLLVLTNGKDSDVLTAKYISKLLLLEI